MCADGYGEGTGNTCHTCDGAASRWLVAAGSLFVAVTLVLLVGAVAFLVGGLDAVQELRRSISRRVTAINLSGTVREVSYPAKRSVGGRDPEAAAAAAEAAEAARAFAPAFNAASEERAYAGAAGESSKERSREDDVAAASPPPSSCRDASEIKSNDSASDVTASASASATAAAAAVRAAEEVYASPPGRGGGEKKGRCCGLGARVKLLWSRLPMDKLKILVVVWQILTAFASITAVDFPPVYSRFLSWISVVNFDVANIFSASCLFPSIGFYHRLLLTTLAPIGLGGALVLTYWMAKRRAGDGPTGELLGRAAWSRHMAAGLLLTFLVRKEGGRSRGWVDVVSRWVPSPLSPSALCPALVD